MFSKSLRIALAQLTIGSSLGLLALFSAPVRAQTNCLVQRGSRSLTCATIYQVYQSVRLNSPRPGFPRLVQQGTVILSNEQLRTLSGSRAELQFNDGSLAWMRPGTIFEFRLGLRLIQLRGGATLVVTEPGAPPVNVRTAEAEARPRGTAYVVQRNEDEETTEVFVLTENPDGPLMVTSAVEGEPPAELRAGEMVSATPDGLSQIEEFDLELFYSTNSLVAGLGPGQEPAVSEKPGSVQQTLNAVRVETLAAVDAQNVGFRRTFLGSAMLGVDVDFALDPEPRADIEDPNLIDGTYEAGEDFDDDAVTGTVTFSPTDSDALELVFEVRDGELQNIQAEQVTIIDRNDIRSSSFGLSGDRATGTVVLESGDVIRIEAFDVNGDLDAGDTVRGRLTFGSSIPDR